MYEIDIFYPENIRAWRSWLTDNHQTQKSVWLVFYRKGSSMPSITWSEAVDVALCFGWIDSKRIKIDEETSHQFFTRRKPKSTWSKINKEKVARFIELGLMTQAGLESVMLAKQNGSWNSLDEIEELIIPSDLEAALLQHESAMPFFESLSKSNKKMALYWISSAKRPETRQKRVDHVAMLSANKEKFKLS
jgi:uncharacterized protein YdeI (YjbR/CyaY-like superfamily)